MVTFSRGGDLAPDCVKCDTCGVVLLDSDIGVHECWCIKCRHPKGPIGLPKGIEEEGYRVCYVCPCDCHIETLQ